MIQRKVFPLLGLLGLALAASGSAYAKSRGPKTPFEFRGKTTLFYGPATYSSGGYSTNLETSITGNQPGIATEFEFWFRRRIGLQMEGSLFTAETNDSKITYHGKYINQAYTGANLGVRLMGAGGVRSAELVSFIGPGISYFTDLRTYPGPLFDVLRVNVMGGKLGLRARIPLGKTCSVEFGGSYFYPYSAIGYGRKSLAGGATYSAAGNLAVEFPLFYSFALSVGYFYQINQLSFQAPGSSSTETVKFTIQAPSLTIRLDL